VGKAERWASAMAHYLAAQEALRPFEERLDLGEETERAARDMLEEIAAPDALTVEITTEFYFNDGLAAPLLKRGRQSLQLRDEVTICAYAKSDTELRDKLLADLKAWRYQLRKLEAAAAKTRAASEAASAAYSAAIRRMDMALLRLIRTPAPTGEELRWKVEALRKRDCSDAVEEAGWTYVAAEVCRFTKPKRKKSRHVLN
jgi:hypothetical protein